MLKKSRTRLLTRAAQKPAHVFAAGYRAATVREWSPEHFFSILLENNTIEKGEILVERVKPLRTAEKDGKYQDFLDIPVIASAFEPAKSSYD